MPRNAHGFLKAEALINGIADTYAVIKADIRHEVTIVHDTRRGGFVTAHRRIPLDAEQLIESDEWQVGSDLQRARELFRQQVRSLGGRA